MKRFLSLMMVFVMSIFLFTGCGKKNEETPPKDETVPYTVGAISDGVYKK